MPELFEEKIQNEIDRLYPVVYHFFKHFPDEKAKCEQAEIDAGIATLNEREVTGVSVQIYDLNKLKNSTGAFDALIPEECQVPLKHRRHVLVNIDYCFGSQAEQILRLLILTFGHNIRSINILGKAGGLVGNRGDILFPTHALDENQNGEMISVDNDDIDPERLQKISGRCVHVGPIITVVGTILQSRELLMFYERLWHATGMEMEASFYLKAINQGKMLGLMDPGIKTRLLYYVSDTPLDPTASLAKKMRTFEGIPPLYAITRVLLKRVLKITDLEDEDRKARLEARHRWAKVRNVVRTNLIRSVRRETFKPSE